MRVLLLGGTGNLGSRVIPALLAHEHSVVAYVRSREKLRGLVPAELLDNLTIVQGDAFDTEAIAATLRTYHCDAVVNTAGNRERFWREQTLGALVTSITSAAVSVGRERGRPLRAWIIGGLGSLKYPSTGYNIQDYLPGWMSEHHRGTERVVRAISTEDLQWSLLCVAMMYPESAKIQALDEPRRHELLVGVSSPPGWRDHWIRNVPVVGAYLNLVPVIQTYTTKYEDVADLIAGDLARGDAELVGKLVGYKAPRYDKVAHM